MTEPPSHARTYAALTPGVAAHIDADTGIVTIPIDVYLDDEPAGTTHLELKPVAASILHARLTYLLSRVEVSQRGMAG